MTTVRARISFLTDLEGPFRVLAGEDFDDTHPVVVAHPENFVDATSVPWATYYQKEIPDSPIAGETWMRPADGYPDQYGAGLFRFDGEGWIMASLVRLNEDGSLNALVTIGDDGNILAARFVDGSMVSEIWLGNEQVYLSDTAGGTVQLSGGNVGIGGAVTVNGNAPAELTGGVFANVTKPTIENATAPDILAALVTLGLVVDDT